MTNEEKLDILEKILTKLVTIKIDRTMGGSYFLCHIIEHYEIYSFGMRPTQILDEIGVKDTREEMGHDASLYAYCLSDDKLYDPKLERIKCINLTIEKIKKQIANEQSKTT